MTDDGESFSPSDTGRAAASFVALIVAAAIVAQHRSTGADFVALGLLICVAPLVRRTGAARLAAAALVGAAAGVVPLAGAALAAFIAIPHRRTALHGLLMAFGSGALTFVAVRTLSPRMTDTAAITAGLDELAVPNLWAEVARWVEPLMPIAALGLIGVMARLRTGLPADAADDAASARAHAVWLLINTTALFVWPRYVAAHLLVWMVPFAVLAPHGWVAAMTLLGRSPGVFPRATALAFLGLMAWWIWLPVRAVRDAALVAWFGT